MNDQDVLVFHRGGHRFAVDVAHVTRVVPPSAAQPVPGAARGVRGMTESGGDVYTLVTTPLPPPQGDRPRWRRWVLLRGSVAFGFEVDAVEGIRAAQERGDDDLPEEDVPGADWEPVITHLVNVDGGTAWVLDVEGLVRAHVERG